MFEYMDELEFEALGFKVTEEEFSEALGFDDYEALLRASEPIIKEGDVGWFVTQLPDGRWAAWDDAEVSLDRVMYFSTRGEAVAFHLGAYAEKTRHTP